MTFGERNSVLISGKYSGSVSVFFHDQREAGMVYILKDIGDFDREAQLCVSEHQVCRNGQSAEQIAVGRVTLGLNFQ